MSSGQITYLVQSKIYLDPGKAPQALEGRDWIRGGLEPWSDNPEGLQRGEFEAIAQKAFRDIYTGNQTYRFAFAEDPMTEEYVFQIVAFQIVAGDQPTAHVVLERRAPHSIEEEQKIWLGFLNEILQRLKDRAQFLEAARTPQNLNFTFVKDKNDLDFKPLEEHGDPLFRYGFNWHQTRIIATLISMHASRSTLELWPGKDGEGRYCIQVHGLGDFNLPYKVFQCSSETGSWEWTLEALLSSLEERVSDWLKERKGRPSLQVVHTGNGFAKDHDGTSVRDKVENR